MADKALFVAVSACRDEQILLTTADNAAAEFQRKIAVHIDTGRKYSRREREQLNRNIAYARQKSFGMLITSDTSVVRGLIRVAEENPAAVLYVGKDSKERRIKQWLVPAIAAKMAEEAGCFELRVAATGGRSTRRFNLPLPLVSNFLQYAIAWFLVLCMATASYFVQSHIGYQSVSLLLLLLVSSLPLLRLGVGPVLSATLLSAFLWDYYFIPPHFTLTIGKLDDTLMLLLYLIVAIVNSSLLLRIVRADKMLRERERRTVSLLQLNKDLAESRGLHSVVAKSVKNIASAFGAKALVIMSENGVLAKDVHPASNLGINQFEWSLANWAFQKNECVGKLAHSLPETDRTYYPLRQGDDIVAVVGIEFENEPEFSYQQAALLDSFMLSIAVCIENERRGSIAARAELMQESEKLYKTLFNSLSHELHTPITTILSAAEGIEAGTNKLDANAVQNLVGEIIIAGNRLHRLVQNLLDIARTDSGMIKPKPDWYDVQDLLHSCANKVVSDYPGCAVAITVPEESAVFRFDYTLLEQAVLNILRNAANYGRGPKPVEVSVRKNGSAFTITIADSGPGIPPLEMAKIFDKFYRLPESGAGGLGLGLSIARGFVEAQGGNISAANRETGGAVFIIQIPLHPESSDEV